MLNLFIDRRRTRETAQTYFSFLFELSELNLEDADAKRYTEILRERLRELNYKENGYILVANKLPAQYRGTAHLSFLKNIPWVAVFDLFDSSSRRDGLLYACNETTDAPRAKIRSLDDFKEITTDKDSLISTRGTTWILNNEEMQKGDWIKCSKDCLYRALWGYKQCFPPGQLVCVFLCLSDTAVNEMADIVENSFSILGHTASRSVTIISESKAVAEKVIKVSKPSLQRELGECSVSGIPWNLLKELVRELMGPSNFEEKGATTKLPHFAGPKEVLSKIVHSWDDLEVYCPDPRLPILADVIEKERDAFYKGAQASQLNLRHNHSIPRSLEKELIGRIERALRSLSKEDVDANYHVKTVTVSYEPGSGATTLCRRILWSERKSYRCAVVKAITPSTAFQIEKLQSIGHDEKNMNYSLPVLLLVDNFPESDVRLLTESIMKRQTKCVILATLPISTSTTHTKFEITLGKLDKHETTLVKDILINITNVNTEKRRGAKQVLEREKRFIWFGLELFGREYLKIKERLQNHIHSILMAFMDDSQREHQMLLDICCFLSKYSDGFVIFPHPAVSDILNERAPWNKQQGPTIQEVHDLFGGLLLEEQNQTYGYYGWRPAHPLVSEVVTSRISVERTAISALEKVVQGKAYVMKFVRHQVFRLVLERKRISDPVFVEEQSPDDGTVGPDLENEVFGFYGKRTRYSPVIMDILEKETCIQGALKVLLTVCELATKTEDEDKAYAWQQLARFMGYEMRLTKMDNLDNLLKRLFSAMKKENPDKQSVPATGIDAAHVAVDIAVSLQPSLSNHYSTKGVLYLLQLSDYKPPSLRTLPEAIEICRKAMSVYDKGRETSGGRSHFSMIGKIQAIISLLGIVKDLPCFDSEDGKFMTYLKEGDAPLELIKVLRPEDQEYIQSLSSTTLDVLNELFANVKFKQTTTYDENEVRSFNNAKIRASLLRRKFYEIIGFDKKEFNSEEYSRRLLSSPSHDLALNQQRAQDVLYFKDETPYSAWSNLENRDVYVIYQLLKSLCLWGHGTHNDMLIYSKACLQLKKKPQVDELDKIVTIFVKKFPHSEWAHLFYYMIHFPVPNGSLARNNSQTKESIKRCASIVQEKAGSRFRKSGAEYFLGKGIGLNAVVNSHEFQWLETKWKSKTHFWRGKEPSERLERVQGQKEPGKKGIISYQGIQIHFDNTLYPNESKDDLWFYLGFTVAGPYAYDPVDNDTYALLKKNALPSTMSQASSESSTTSSKLSTSPGGHGTRRRGRSIPSQQPGTDACKLEYDYEESTRSDSENFGNRNARNRTRDGVSDDTREEITMGGPLYACGNGESSSEESKSVWTVNKHGTQRKGCPIPWQQPGTGACTVGEYYHDESTCSDFENFGNRIARNRPHDTVEEINISNPLYASESEESPQKESESVFQWKTVERRTSKAKESPADGTRVKSKRVVGTRGNEKRYFEPKYVAQEGKLRHGAFVLGTKKSKECSSHKRGCESTLTDKCKYAHGWRGDTLQFVCTKCTAEEKVFCKEKVNHKPYIWNLGPYLDSRGEIWKDEKAV